MKRVHYIVLSTVLVFSLLGLLFYGLFYASNPKEIPSALTGKKAPNFNLTTFVGKPISLEEFSGKPVILNFWASWCLACKREAPLLERANKRFSPQGGVMIGIAFNDKLEDAIEHAKELGKTYYLASDNDKGSVSLEYGITGIPETFFIDKQGIIKHKHLGAITYELLSKFYIEQLNLI